ncbi:MAG: TlpA disulfide reductase family protein [Gammaproteobacteria bacterium]|nr:TlpA disulfide reductase family protein [Gammaproteobacteria bacterium]MDE0178152.1 TlpA disulfide reductase family protein [Gammaproteobacteria bacterium]MDE0441118.1 TlpA disulfide reductase family protein [Gammaproteobacteria bacterium]
MRRWTPLLASAAFLFAMAVLAVPEVGDVPPAYLGKDRQGKKVDLKDLRGKVVIVSFWATWCPPCRKELPVLETLQQHAGRDRVRVVAINIERPRAYRRMERRLKDYTMTLINDYNGRTKKRFGVSGIPHLVMIRKDGTVAAIKRGYTEEMVPAMIDEVNALMRTEYAAATQAP